MIDLVSGPDSLIAADAGEQPDDGERGESAMCGETCLRTEREPEPSESAAEDTDEIGSSHPPMPRQMFRTQACVELKGPDREGNAAAEQVHVKCERHGKQSFADERLPRDRQRQHDDRISGDRERVYG